MINLLICRVSHMSFMSVEFFSCLAKWVDFWFWKCQWLTSWVMESSDHNPKSELKDSDCEDDQWDIFQTGDDATEEDDKLDGEEGEKSACENLPRDYLVDLWPFARRLRCLVGWVFEHFPGYWLTVWCLLNGSQAIHPATTYCGSNYYWSCLSKTSHPSMW